MKKSLWPLLSFLCKLCLLVVGCGLIPPALLRGNPAEGTDEPTYGGHPLSYWLDDLQLESSEMPTPLRQEAKVAVAHIGTNAIPFLLRRMRDGGPFGFDSGSIEAFGILGSEARAAIPELARLATNQADRVASPPGLAPHSIAAVGHGRLLALGRIGPEALPVLSTIVTNSTVPGVRLGAIEAINSMGPQAVFAVSILLDAVNDENEFVASAAVRGLGVVGPGDLAAVTALSNLALGPKRDLRPEALSALAHCGTPAAPALIRTLNDPQEYFLGFTSLIAAAPQALTNATVLEIGAEGLCSTNAERRLWAAQLLRAAGQQASAQRPDYAVPGGRWDEVLQDATNALRRLAPQLLKNGVR
jgi:HEAT repeat protein